MPEIHRDLYEANLAALRHHHTALADCIKESGDEAELFPRSDGYFYARRQYGNGYYHLSRSEAVAEDLYAFRNEIQKAVQKGADLFFLLGIGLGYRLIAAWETLECYQSGHIVVLEESPAMLHAACRTSDLRRLFLSPRCEWICHSPIKEEFWKTIVQQSWFGAAGSAFFWGYQVDDSACQPPYGLLAQETVRFMAEEQSRFVQCWREWIVNKKIRTTKKIALIYEEKNENAALSQRALLDESAALIPVRSEDYISKTLLMQRIMESGADELAWVGIEPERWIPAEIFRTIPLPSRLMPLRTFS
ncbi:MAG: hypothetical protein AB1656_20440 [Candidatus Omnitrophota bacterium]